MLGSRIEYNRLKLAIYHNVETRNRERKWLRVVYPSISWTQMHTEEKKGNHELEVFSAFIKRAGLPVHKGSIEKRPVGEPDILCKVVDTGYVAFELARICDPALAALLNQRKPQSINFIRTSDPSLKILKKKRSRAYDTAHPIELLLYTDGRVITPDDVIIPTIKPYLECDSGPYRRAWFMGKTTVECIYEAS